MPVAKIHAIDHVVLTVASINATVSWYRKYLGVSHETFGSSDGQRNAMSLGSQKINLHESGAEFEPKAQNVQPGSGDLCFITDTPVDGVLGRLKDDGVDVLEGGKVVERTGARGKLRSVYIRDPDGNLIE